MSRDWVGEWFTILQEQGEDTSIALGRKNLAGDIVWNNWPHSEVDGITALEKQCLKDQVNYTFVSTKTTAIKRLSFFENLILFFQYVKISGHRHTKWVQRNLSPKYLQPTPTSLALGILETENLERRSKMLKVSVNTLCLDALNRATKDLFSSNESRGWFLPINMRPYLPTQAGTAGNVCSHVGIDVNDQDTPSRLHARVRNAFITKQHWAAWATARIGSWVSPLVGDSGARRLMRTIWRHHAPPAHSWAGVFSNLGVVQSADASGYYFCPPCTRVQPIAAGALIWNRQLRLSLRLHPCLETQESAARDILDRWAHELKQRVERLDTPVSPEFVVELAL